MLNKLNRGIIFTLFCFSLIACESSGPIDGSAGKAFLDIVVSANDSMQVEYDDEILFREKLIYSGIFGYSWFKRINPAEVGNHRIIVTVFNDLIEAERTFFIEDTMTIYVSYWPEWEKKVKFTTRNERFYGE